MGKIEFLNFGEQYPNITRTAESAIEQWRLSADKSFNAYKKKVLMVIGLDEIGECHMANDFIRAALKTNNESGHCFFTNTVVAFIVLSPNDFFTKTYAKKFSFMINQLGAELIGHPMLEITHGYNNMKTWAINLKCSFEEAAIHLIHQLVSRLAAYDSVVLKTPRILVLHAGDERRSNTLMLWNRVENQLLEHFGEKIVIKKLHVEDGKIRDCFGCSYATCTYHAAEKSCFYGGFVVEELFPEIEKADYLVWVCPNYNDAVSAKLTAVINRLTALYRTVSFRDKYLLGVIVSANSGNDTVASQLLGALSINKGFRLPPYFALMAQANAPGEILKDKNLTKIVNVYSEKIFENLNNNVELSEKSGIINISKEKEMIPPKNN